LQREVAAGWLNRAQPKDTNRDGRMFRASLDLQSNARLPIRTSSLVYQRPKLEGSEVIKAKGPTAMLPTADELRASLTDTQRAVLAAVVAAPLAWINLARLSDRFGASTIAELERLDLVVRWTLPTEDCMTLTPWGEFLLHVEIDERFRTVSGCTVEVPFWVEAGKKSESVMLPKYPKQVGLPFPDRIPDPRPEPEVLVDEASGEPVILFAGDGSGYTIRIDRRLKGAGPTKKSGATDRYLYRPPPAKSKGARSNGKCSVPTRTLSNG
jgi:hypothetical protein